MNTRLKHSAGLQPSCWQSLTKQQPKARCSHLSHPSKWKCCAQCWLCVHSSWTLIPFPCFKWLWFYRHFYCTLTAPPTRWNRFPRADENIYTFLTGKLFLVGKKYLICMGINLGLFSLSWKMLLNIITLGYVVVIAHLLSLRTPYLLNHLSCSYRD